MAFSFTSGPHQTVQRQFPPNKYRIMNTGTWGANSNTCVITDPGITTNSFVHVQVTGTTPAAGRWSYSYAAGSVTITSSTAESSTLAMQYYVD